MTCRAPTSSLTCTGTSTGQALSYDGARQLIAWQNAPTSPTSTASYAYDGAGTRVEQAVTTSGTTTTTEYIGSYEEVSKTGSSTTTTKYYTTPLGTCEAVNAGPQGGSGTYYLVGDGLGSVSMALSTLGTVTATQLFAPYGGVRYSTGTMPTSFNFTGQRSDPSGLLYDASRYYDSSIGQFISADAVEGGDRYAYVSGNPETLTDPTGQYSCGGTDSGFCNPGGSPAGGGGSPGCSGIILGRVCKRVLA